MLPKNKRANKKDIDLLFKKGRFIASPILTFKFLINTGNGRKISFIVPKSVAKLAVKRNSLRRKGYDALGKYLDRFPVGIIGSFVFKKYQEDVSIIEDEIKNILNKIH